VKVSLGKVGAVVMGGLLLAWGLALFVGLPFLYAKKVEALVGQPLEVVRRELGPPKQEWTAAAFACAPGWSCAGAARGGPVLLYADPSQAWYLYFDGVGTLAAVEKSLAPDAGGT
jgi:hypothetical protein